jgi:hypothetical protein
MLGIGVTHITLFDPATWRQTHQIEKGQRRAAVISPDGTVAAIVASTGEGAHVTRWNLASGKKVNEWTGTVKHDRAFEDVWAWDGGLSKDGRRLMIQFYDGQSARVGVFDARTGRKLCAWSLGRQSIRPVFHVDGRMVACFRPDGNPIELREIATGDCRTGLPVQSSVASCNFSPDGKHLAIATSPGPVELWSLAGKTEPWRPNKANALWAALLSQHADVAYVARDSDPAYVAITHLQAHPPQAVALLKSKMKVLVAPAAEWTVLRIKDLDAAEFRKREKATSELAEVGELVLPQLRDALAKASPEARERLNALIPKAAAMTPEKLRAIRACEVLEGTATPEAKALLAEWAKGPAAATLTREATESLERLKRR